VFKLGDKWYMIALTGDAYGQSQRWNDPEITCATVVFQADRPEGPFEEVRDNLLLASKKNVWQGFSGRTVLHNGERLMFFTRCEGINGRGSLSWPVKIVPRKGGGLDPMYWSGNDTAFGPAAKLARKGRPMSDIAFMVTAIVELKDAKAAGIAFGNYLALIDSAGQVSLVDAAAGKTIQDRLWPIVPAGTYKLRLVMANEMVDVYVDDVLVIDYYLAEVGNGGVSLVTREGTRRFVDASYRAVRATETSSGGAAEKTPRAHAGKQAPLSQTSSLTGPVPDETICATRPLRERYSRPGSESWAGEGVGVCLSERRSEGSGVQ